MVIFSIIIWLIPYILMFKLYDYLNKKEEKEKHSQNEKSFNNKETK